MPKLPTDYDNCKIYKIVCKNLDVKDCYVGWTTNFIQCKSNHKQKCKKDIDRIILYNVIKYHGGWDNWEMIEIEKFKCNDRNELNNKRREWREKLNANLHDSNFNYIRTKVN